MWTSHKTTIDTSVVDVTLITSDRFQDVFFFSRPSFFFSFCVEAIIKLGTGTWSSKEGRATSDERRPTPNHAYYVTFPKIFYSTLKASVTNNRRLSWLRIQTRPFTHTLKGTSGVCEPFSVPFIYHDQITVWFLYVFTNSKTSNTMDSSRNVSKSILTYYLNSLLPLRTHTNFRSLFMNRLFYINYSTEKIKKDEIKNMYF